MLRSVTFRYFPSASTFFRQFHIASANPFRPSLMVARIRAFPLVAAKMRTFLPMVPIRFGSTQSTPSETEDRVLSVLKNFDKVDSTKLSISTPFTQLGLDSLDVVEVMIALEEEFHMEIPDAVADKAQTPKEIAEYIFGFLNPHKPTEPDNISEDPHH